MTEKNLWENTFYFSHLVFIFNLNKYLWVHRGEFTDVSHINLSSASYEKDVYAVGIQLHIRLFAKRQTLFCNTLKHGTAQYNNHENSDFVTIA